MSDLAATALYAALQPTVAEPIEELAQMKKDREYTEAIAHEYGLRLYLSRWYAARNLMVQA